MESFFLIKLLKESNYLHIQYKVFHGTIQFYPIPPNSYRNKPYLIFSAKNDLLNPHLSILPWK